MINTFANAKFLNKIGISFGLLFCVIVGIGTSSFLDMRSIRDGGNEIYDNYFTSVLNLTSIEGALASIYISQKSHIIAPNDETMLEMEKRIETATQTVTKRMDAFAATLDPGAETEAFNQYKDVISNIFELNEQIITLSASNNDEVADKLSNSTLR